MTDKPLTIAFSSPEGASWLGGLNYLQNIVAALNSLDDADRPCLKLTAFADSDKDMLQGILPAIDEVIPRPESRGSLPARLLNRVRKEKQELVMGPLLRQHGVDCLFDVGQLGPGFQVPLLAWIPDFQHLHLTEMFSPQEIKDRNQAFAKIAQFATLVMVTSEDVKRDFLRFAPEQADKVHVISGVSQVPASIYDADPEWVCQEYHLPQKFFYVPNQFWKHKNHEIILEALACLQSKHPEIAVVCTGNTYDDRHPRYFSHLLNRIAQLGLRNNFLILGIIPQQHTLHLMRQSLAVLQPSRFEGWSNAVAEVKSVGKRIILSDLPVHREHNPAGAVFFDPSSPAQLAQAMQAMFENEAPGPDYQMEEAARKNLHTRTQQFGKDFAALAQETTSSFFASSRQPSIPK